MPNSSRQNFFIALLLNGVLFLLLLLLFNPVFNSDADIYFLYTLSGGYGNPPSALLHYSDVGHPILAVIISALFKYFQGFNWYTLFLLLFHFVSCTSLLLVFLRYFKKPFAITSFIVFFLFIESRLLLGFNFSGAALTGVISGSVCLLLYLKNAVQGTRLDRRKILFYSLLIVIGGLTRLHYMLLFGGFTIWMSLFFLSRVQIIRFIKIQFILGLLLLLFFQGQRFYFQQKIPGWKAEEKMRKARINITNQSIKLNTTGYNDTEKLKAKLVWLNFLYDKKLVTYETIKDLGKKNKQGEAIKKDISISLYWLFMDVRVYLFLFAVVSLFFIVNRDRKTLFRFIYMSVFCVLAYGIIGFFFKTTEVILLAVLASVLLSALLCMSKTVPSRISIGVVVFATLLNCIWMVVRLYKTNERNKQEINYARSVISELNSHPDILFVDVGNSFDLHLSIWDVPKQYPINNFLYYVLCLNNSYGSQLANYGITDLMREIPLKSNIYLVGKQASMLTEYYRLIYNRSVSVMKVPGFKYIDAYQLSADDNK